MATTNVLRRVLAAGLLLLATPAAAARAQEGAPAQKPARVQAAAGLTEHHLTVAGTDRSYLYHEPSRLAGRSKPLVLVFHGGLGNGARVAAQSGFADVADRAGFAVAFPDAIGQWKDGRSTVGADPADVEFVRMLVDRLIAEHHVDPRRVYATGISNGGMFTLRLACELSDVFAAVAPVSASFPVTYYPRCKPGRPLPILMINGTADRLIQWNGGTIMKGRLGGAGGEVIPVPETVDFWRLSNGCAERPAVKSLPDTDPRDGTTVQVLTYGHCRAGATVELVKIVGGGHAWPGSHTTTPRLLLRLVGPVSRDIDAADIVWSFFSRVPAGPASPGTRRTP